MTPVEMRAIEVEFPRRAADLKGFRRWLRFLRERNFTTVAARLAGLSRPSALFREAAAASGAAGLEVAAVVPSMEMTAAAWPIAERWVREMTGMASGGFLLGPGAAPRGDERRFRFLSRFHALCQEMGRRFGICFRPGREARPMPVHGSTMLGMALRGWPIPCDVVSHWEGGEAVRHAPLAAGMGREGVTGAFLSFSGRAPGAERGLEALPEVAFVGGLWSDPARAVPELFDEVLAELLPVSGASVRRAVHGVMAHPGWQAPPADDHFDGAGGGQAARPFREFLVYEGLLRGAVLALPEGRERRIVLAFHRRVVRQLRAEPAMPSRRRTSRPPLRRAARTLCAGAPRNMVAFAVGGEGDWRPGVSAVATLDHSGPFLRVRLFAPKWGRRPELTVEIRTQAGWRECCRNARFDSAVVLLETPLPPEYRRDDWVRIKVAGAEGGGILYAAVMLEDQVVDLRPTAETGPPPSRTPHGIPFFLSPMEERMETVVLASAREDGG